MTVKTLYHATDATNINSIMQDGLRADDRGLVFVTTSKPEAERVGELYASIDETAVLSVEVNECQIREDPDPHGDLDSRAVSVSGDIAPQHLEVI